MMLSISVENVVPIIDTYDVYYGFYGIYYYHVTLKTRVMMLII